MKSGFSTINKAFLCVVVRTFILQLPQARQGLGCLVLLWATQHHFLTPPSGPPGGLVPFSSSPTSLLCAAATAMVVNALLHNDRWLSAYYKIRLHQQYLESKWHCQTPFKESEVVGPSTLMKSGRNRQLWSVGTTLHSLSSQTLLCWYNIMELRPLSVIPFHYWSSKSICWNKPCR